MGVDRHQEVNELIREYLVAYQYKSTILSFEREATAKGIPILSVLPHHKKSPHFHKVQTQFLHSFRDGDEALFFALWDDHFQENKFDSDATFQRLEFFLSVYFAVYPLLPNVSKPKLYNIQSTMDRFKHFLETRGAHLSKNPHYLSYFALPYVPDPRTHPSFAEIFSHNWVPDLEEKLKAFVERHLNDVPQPRLLTLVENSDKGFAAIMKENMDNQSTQLIRRLQEEKRDAEVVKDQTQAKLRHLQNDYHNLINVASDLVQTLAASISGKKITPGYLSTIVSRLTHLKKGSNPTNPEIDPTPLLGRTGQPPLPSTTSKASPIQHAPNANALPKSGSSPSRRIEECLDYGRIKQDLSRRSTDEAEGRQTAFLIQALRWRLSRAETALERRQILDLFISQDFLGMNSVTNNLAVSLLSHPSFFVRDQIGRLMNTIATDCAGREYLLESSGSLIVSLVQAMKAEENDTEYRQNILGTLQKLSLRRMAQSAMNKENVILYLQDLLEDFDGLSEYTIEYGSALLMNLSLRTRGKAACAENPPRTFKILNQLMEHDNVQVKTYVNGILYSILSHISLREYARSIGLEDQLKYLKEQSDEQLIKQIDFVIERLNSDEDTEDNFDTISEDGEEEDNVDEEDEPIIEEEESHEIQPANENEKVGIAILQEYTTNASKGTLSPNQHQSESPVRKNHAITMLERSLSRLASKHDLTRPKTPSRSSTPVATISRSTSRLATVRPPLRDAPMKPGSRNDMTTSQVSSPVSLNTEQLTAPTKKDIKRAPGKIPTTRDEIQEFEIAFSTRPKIARTPTTEIEAQANTINSNMLSTHLQGAKSIGHLSERVANRAGSRLSQR